MAIGGHKQLREHASLRQSNRSMFLLQVRGKLADHYVAGCTGRGDCGECGNDHSHGQSTREQETMRYPEDRFIVGTPLPRLGGADGIQRKASGRRFPCAAPANWLFSYQLPFHRMCLPVAAARLRYQICEV